jgi:hypothetical protein
VRLSQLGGLKISKASSMPGEKRTSVKADAWMAPEEVTYQIQV